MLNNAVLSLIRTYVPIGIGLLLTLLAREYGVIVDEDAGAGLTAGVVAVVSAVWYALARFLESRWPWLSIALGTPPSVSTPSYTKLPQ